VISNLAEAAGWIGAFLLFTAYLLVSLGRLAGHGVLFQLLNVAGSTGLAVASAAGGVWPSVALNAVWIGIGVFILIRHAVRRRAATRGVQPLSEMSANRDRSSGPLTWRDWHAPRMST
jgi:hypothetical protein